MEVFEQEKINQIIAAYLENRISSNDLVDLENWIKASKENRDYFLQLKNIAEITANHHKIDTERAHLNVLARISEQSQKTKYLHFIQKAAAILLIPVILGSIIWNISNTKKTNSYETTYNEVFAAYGTRSAINLSDGSKVWLNSGSSLRYPLKFSSNQRKVFLKGEAYFEVQSDKMHPFVVETQNISVKATGTNFNVAAFENRSSVEVTLLTGKVTVNKTSENSSRKILAEMKPNQHYKYDFKTNASKLTDQDVSKFVAWKDGKLIFRNDPLSLVVQKISQLYNVEIELQGKELQEYRYRATFEEESLNEILKLLKLSSPIDFKEISREPLSDGTFPKRKIIIFPLNKTK
jgi:ferric-dicitrate binding protein FerR (iron transport regulator)